MSAAEIDRLLEHARLEPRPYSAEELAAAEERLVARVTDDVLHDLLSYDDDMRSILSRQPQPESLRRSVWQPDGRLLDDAAGALRAVCRTTLGEDNALHELSSFLQEQPLPEPGDETIRMLEPEGAAILGCVLQLAAREDSARLWWQYAAGAGHRPATYCLYLQHLALGELSEADWWLGQMMPAPETAAGEHLVHGLVFGPEGKPPTATVLMRRTLLTEAAEAIVSYVPTAIEYDDALDLPLPTEDFAQHVEALAALT